MIDKKKKLVDIFLNYVFRDIKSGFICKENGVNFSVNVKVR